MVKGSLPLTPLSWRELAMIVINNMSEKQKDEPVRLWDLSSEQIHEARELTVPKRDGPFLTF